MLNNIDDFLTVDEACDIMKIGHNAIYNLLRSGNLKAFRNGRVWRIPKESIITYAKEMARLNWIYYISLAWHDNDSFSLNMYSPGTVVLGLYNNVA